MAANLNSFCFCQMACYTFPTTLHLRIPPPFPFDAFDRFVSPTCCLFSYNSDIIPFAKICIPLIVWPREWFGDDMLNHHWDIGFLLVHRQWKNCHMQNLLQVLCRIIRKSSYKKEKIKKIKKIKKNKINKIFTESYLKFEWDFSLSHLKTLTHSIKILKDP